MDRKNKMKNYKEFITEVRRKVTTEKEISENMKDEVYELKLYIENDADLYRQKIVPIVKNIQRKMKSGKYDHSKAPKLWMYLVDEGAKKYSKEFPGVKFDKKVKQKVAQEFADEYKEEISENFEEFMEVRDKSKGDWTKLPDNFWVLIDRSKGKMGEVIKTGKTKPKFTSSKSQELMTVKKAKQWFGIK